MWKLMVVVVVGVSSEVFVHWLGEVSLLSSALPPSDRLLAPGHRAFVGCRWQVKAGLPSPGLPEVQYGAKLALSC